MTNKNISRRKVVKAGLATAAGMGVGAAAAAQQPPAEKQTGRLRGRVALVTGAARGIGRAIAVAYSREGADVIVLDIAARVEGTRDYEPATPADLAETARQVKAEGRRCVMAQADVRDLEAMRKAVDRAAGDLGGLDIAVANAGIVVWTSFEDARDSPEDYYRVVDVNVNGVWNTCWAALPYLKKSKAGRIVTLASIGGRMGVAGNGAYAATKWAVIGATKSLALELGKYHITANALAPTAVDTPMYRSAGQRASTGMASAGAQDTAMLGYHALPVPAVEPRDIADGAVFLASDEARYVSGLVLDIAAGGNARYTG